MTLETLKSTITKLNDEVLSYEAKPTKAASKRIRLLLGNLKSATPTYRAMLVNLDKASR